MSIIPANMASSFFACSFLKFWSTGWQGGSCHFGFNGMGLLEHHLVETSSLGGPRSLDQKDHRCEHQKCALPMWVTGSDDEWDHSFFYSSIPRPVVTYHWHRPHDGCWFGICATSGRLQLHSHTELPWSPNLSSTSSCPFQYPKKMPLLGMLYVATPVNPIAMCLLYSAFVLN